jgi:pyroglutamyl-peptidase
MAGAATARAGGVLVTGFEPYGGRGLNPARDVARALDGTMIAGHLVAGRTLPVSYDGLARRLSAMIDELRPSLVISLGLWPGETAIRLERFGLNLADFEIPDNEGALLADAPIVAEGGTGLRATLPLRAIEAALLASGIPARLSSTAGTFLCNAALYQLLYLLGERAPGARGGFIHLPYLPEQVALLLRETREARRLELHQRADVASMALPLQAKAVSIAIATALGEATRER